jgi:hypothetical protein
VDRIPIFPLRTILFPHTDLGIHVFEECYRSLVGECLDTGDGFGVVLIRRGREVGGPADPHTVGTMARISAHARLPDGRYLLEVVGGRRFRIVSLNGTAPYPQANVTWLQDPIGDFGKARNASDQVDGLLQLYRLRLGETDAVDLPVDPVARSYAVACQLRIDPPEKQSLLETESADARLQREVGILRRELAQIDTMTN